MHRLILHSLNLTDNQKLFRALLVKYCTFHTRLIQTILFNKKHDFFLQILDLKFKKILFRGKLKKSFYFTKLLIGIIYSTELVSL